jgi:hypothetical protein
MMQSVGLACQMVFGFFAVLVRKAQESGPRYTQEQDGDPYFKG